ncbi:MAG: hypothetical protein ACQEVA_13620 [Myxococcota bacterium]
MEVLPKSAKVDVETSPIHGGLVGVIEALYAGLELELGDDAPDARELMCMSGVAFKNYVYEPQFNQFEDPGREFSNEAHFVCNYGPFESLAYYTGFDIKEFNGISRDDFWTLLRVELSSGRPVISMGLKGPLQPALVTAYDESEHAPQVTVARARTGETEDVDLTGEAKMQGDSESFSNWLVIARPGEASEWTPSANRQRLRVLRWVESHAQRPKEFSQETRENYAPGLRGFDAFQRFLEGHAAEDFEDFNLVDYALTHVEELAHGRRAAATRLPRWGEELRDDENIALNDADAIVAAFSTLAGAYSGVSEPLEGWLDAHVEDDWVEMTGAALGELREAHDAARAAEQGAVAHLQTLVADLPNLF